MARVVLVVLVSLLVLAGCEQPSSPVERQEKNEGAEKAVQQDGQADGAAKSGSGETAKKAAPEPNPKPRPQPQPEQKPAKEPPPNERRAERERSGMRRTPVGGIMAVGRG